jgi:hypothetical protein
MKSRRRWAENAARMGYIYIRNAYIFDERPERRRLFGRSKRDDNIKMNLKEVRRKAMDWIHLAQIVTKSWLL